MVHPSNSKMVNDENGERNRDIDRWCRRRTKVERKLFCILIVAVLLIVGLVITSVILGTSGSRQQYCLTDVCIKEAANLLSRMNFSIQPCEDFYEFVCGRYIEESVIPDDKTELDTLGLISDLVNFQVKTVITEPSPPNEIEPILMLKKMYRACMNLTLIQNNGLQQMKTFLNRLGGWPILEGNKWLEIDWINLTEKLRQNGFSTDHFITIDVDANPKNSSEYVISIDEGKNEEINESNLKNGLEDDLVQTYAEFLIDLAVLFGADREFATNEVQDLIDYRANVAKFIVSKSEHYKLLINCSIMTVAELQLNYPTLNWADLFNKFLAIPSQSITNSDKVALVTPKYIDHFVQIISNTSKRVQANHVLFEIIRSNIDFLPKEMRKREQKFIADATGATKSRPRWDICIDKATNAFNLAADSLYIRKYGNEEAKEEVNQMVSHIKHVFVNLLKNVEWMDNETKQKAIEKAELITAHVAYPTELRDETKLIEYYKGVKFDSDNILELISEITKFKRNKILSYYGKPVIKSHWSTRIAAITSNAFYDPQENSIQIPAGIMQKEFYTKGKPNYMNYGGLGLVIGHELTHGFDSDGKWFNKMGNVMNWWKKSTDEAFGSKAECFVEQYSNFTVPELDIKLDGENTLAENIADNGGAKEAYLAYLEWIKQNNHELPLPGFRFSDKQLFWISLTNAWCTKSRESSIEQIVLGDEHSPDRYRILGALSNMQYFAKDFNCPLGSKMNPIKKCQIW